MRHIWPTLALRPINRITLSAPRGRVGEVGGAELIQEDDVELVHAYALCAKMYGFSLLYLEAGSGADTPVHAQLIKRATSVEGLTLLVGGGLRTLETYGVLLMQALIGW